jgi:hypothetical protein
MGGRVPCECPELEIRWQNRATLAKISSGTRWQKRAERAEALVELQKQVAALLGTPLAGETS